MDRLPSVSIKNDLNLIIPSHFYPIASSVIRHTIFSCKDFSSNVPFTCQEMGHGWDSSCFRSACYLFIGCFREGINIYGALYAVSEISIKKKSKKKQF